MVKKSVGIIYLLTNTQLAARLVVSLYSLRQWYAGPITVFTTRDTSYSVGEYCANDPHLRVDHRQIDERDGEGYTSSYLTKTKILDRSPYDSTVFLDADTVVVNDISELLHATANTRLTATGFIGWSTQDEPIRGRLEKWRELQNTPEDTYQLEKRIDALLKYPHTGINTGVFGYQNDPSLVERWDNLAWMARDLPHPDEISMQLMLLEEEHQILGHQYNCHPWNYHVGMGVHIWHFAGRSHLLPESIEVWVPVYEECQRLNVADIRRWSRLEPNENKQQSGATING